MIDIKTTLEKLQEYKLKGMFKEFWEEFDKKVIEELLITGEIIIK